MTWPQVVGYTCHSHQNPPPGSKAQGHHQGMGQWHRLHMSTWISGFFAAWGMNHSTNIASLSIIGHGGSLRKSNTESELSSSWSFIVAQSQEDPAAGRQVWGLSLHLHKLPVYISSYVHHPTDPAGQPQQVNLSLFSQLSPQSLHLSPQCITPSLSTVHTPLCFSI